MGDSGSPLQWDSRAPQTPWQGRWRAALFPSLYLPDNGTIQQVLNVLMGFWRASVAHLPQGHFTPPWEPGPTGRKKRPVVCRMNLLLAEAPENHPRIWGALCSPSATLLQAQEPRHRLLQGRGGNSADRRAASRSQPDGQTHSPRLHGSRLPLGSCGHLGGWRGSCPCPRYPFGDASCGICAEKIPARSQDQADSPRVEQTA